MGADLVPGARAVKAPRMGEEFGESAITERLYVDGKQDVKNKNKNVLGRCRQRSEVKN